MPFDTAKALAELLGRLLHARHPTISTMERARGAARRAVYIDTGQTGRSRAIVGALLRARAIPARRVSTPLRWDEVGQALVPGALHMFTRARARRASTATRCNGMLAAEPDLERAVAALGELLPR